MDQPIILRRAIEADADAIARREREELRDKGTVVYMRKVLRPG
jgi:hypothetical protein